MLNRQGKYVGTLTEGDILWGAEEVPRAGPGSSRRGAHLGLSAQAGLQGRDRDHQHGSAGGSRHESELCARGG